MNDDIEKIPGFGKIDFPNSLLDIFRDELNSLRKEDDGDRSRLYDQAEFIGIQIIKGER
ncbi:MAG: hypothetical protein ABIE07_01005 [Candidatus Zixiibacteriota bacterium]